MDPHGGLPALRTLQTLFVLDQSACPADRSACAVIVLDIEGYSSAEIADILEVGEQKVRDLRSFLTLRRAHGAAGELLDPGGTRLPRGIVVSADGP